MRWLILGGVLAVALVAACSPEEGEPFFDPERYPLSSAIRAGEVCGASRG